MNQINTLNFILPRSRILFYGMGEYFFIAFSFNGINFVWKKIILRQDVANLFSGKPLDFFASKRGE